MAGGGRCHTAVHPIEVGCCPCRLPPRSRPARLHVRRPFYANSPSGAAWPYPGGTVQEQGHLAIPSPGVGRRVRLHPVLVRSAGRDVPIRISQAVGGPVQ